MSLQDVPQNVSFPKEEEAIVELWDRLDAFQTSLKKSEGRPEYSFYDGPPFATGLPHYGHILAGTIKDIVTRYAHQTGHHVTRRFGWDCHGLPIEFEIDKELGIKTRDDVLAMGIDKYNEACRGIVMRYSKEWERIVKRLGRWIDFKNDYKTMDRSFMESVWWVFKQLYEKQLVYRGFKVMPYSMACNTPLSNFEANLLYKNVNDPSVIVSFPLESDPSTALIAWTTTPWTLPSNLALCVHPDFDYVKIRDAATGNLYILLEKRLVQLYKDPSKGAEYEVLERFKGASLQGKTYVPLFDYFVRERANGAFRVLADTYVTDDSGTGVVHCAPAFGEDDFRVCLEAGIIAKGRELVCPVDANGKFMPSVGEFAGMYIKDADKHIIRKLKEMKRLVHQSTIVHSYPFCWRSETPLIYRAVPSWFVAVEKLRDRLLENNRKTYWVPDFVQEKRFANWLADARDWCVSRNRYWGTPLPIWISEDEQEVVVVGSVAELEALSGVSVGDLHRHNIDHIKIPSRRGPQYGMLSRVDEVFDCWFESGSMPYAQCHYPFENTELFTNSFPADFIAEGLDQTRGWFYTLMVLSTALFDKPAFKNLIVNGLVLAADGKKMSKRLKNYPDPQLVVDRYGADALRLYLINSPVVRAEPLRFKEEGVSDVIKDVFLPWFNAYRFFVQNARAWAKRQATPFVPDVHAAVRSANVMDKWILAACSSLIRFVRGEMAAYRLYTVVPRLVSFINQLTNWYVRFNRKRLKGAAAGTDDADSLNALRTLFEVLLTMALAMAPFTPFFTEYMYQNLRAVLPVSVREDSVHYLSFPEPFEGAENADIERAVGYMQTVIELGRTARERRTRPIKHPLKELTVLVTAKVGDVATAVADIRRLESYIVEELNIKQLIITTDESRFIRTVVKPDESRLGKRLRGAKKAVMEALVKLSAEQLEVLRTQGKLVVEGHEVTSEDVCVLRELTVDTTKFEAVLAEDVGLGVVLDLAVDAELAAQGLAREVTNRVQKMRKKAGLVPSDPIELFYGVDPTADRSGMQKVFASHAALIHSVTSLVPVHADYMPHTAMPIIREKVKIGESMVNLIITRLGVAFSLPKLDKKFPGNAADVGTLLACRDYNKVREQLSSAGFLEVNLNGVTAKVVLGEDVFLSSADYVQSLRK